MLDRLDSSIVDPVAVSLLIGTNDLHGPRASRDLAGIADRTRQIVRAIRDRAPEALVLLNSVTPRTALLAPRIRELNRRYAEIAAETGCTFVDLWPALAVGEDLRKDYTRDNLHLTPAGFLAWAEVLRPHLSRFSRGTADTPAIGAGH